MTSDSVIVAMVVYLGGHEAVVEVDRAVSPIIRRVALAGAARSVHLGVAPDQRVDEAGHARDAGTLQDHRVLDLGVAIAQSSAATAVNGPM
jgi:hypothetical protein